MPWSPGGQVGSERRREREKRGRSGGGGAHEGGGGGVTGRRARERERDGCTAGREAGGRGLGVQIASCNARGIKIHVGTPSGSDSSTCEDK